MTSEQADVPAEETEDREICCRNFDAERLSYSGYRSAEDRPCSTSFSQEALARGSKGVELRPDGCHSRCSSQVEVDTASASGETHGISKLERQDRCRKGSSRGTFDQSSSSRCSKAPAWHRGDGRAIPPALLMLLLMACTCPLHVMGGKCKASSIKDVSEVLFFTSRPHTSSAILSLSGSPRQLQLTMGSSYLHPVRKLQMRQEELQHMP